MPSPILPSTSSFPFPAQHADNPDGGGLHGGAAAGGDHQPNDLPGHDGHGGGRTDNNVGDDRGQLDGQGRGDGDGSSGPDESGRGVVGRGNNGGNGGNEGAGGGSESTPGQTNPGLPGGRAGGANGSGGANGYGNGGSNVYGNGGANTSGGIYGGGATVPRTGGLGGLLGQVSQVTSSITTAVFGTVVNSNPASLPNLFTDDLPRFVGDSAARAQPSNDYSAPQPQSAPPSPQRATNDAAAVIARTADPTPQPPANPAAGAPEAEGRGLLAQTPAQPGVQPGIDARTAQVLVQGGIALAPMETPPESSAQMAAMTAPTAREADALERALMDGANKSPLQRTDGKDMPTQLRQAAAPEGETATLQQAAQARQQTDALDRMLAKLPADARPMLDAKGVDGRQLDPRVADGRLVQADALVRSTAETNASRQAGDLAKAATATEGGRLPVAADGKSAQSSFGRGLFGGTVEYTRQALDWVGQQVREFSFGASPDADGARAMRVVAGLLVASVAVLVAVGVLYALRVIFVA